MTHNRKVRPDCSPSYFRAWLANPLKFGAVAPSGAALASLITSEIIPGDGPIVELGPGKGVFTRALLRRGVAESELILVEQRADFARVLQRMFPKARVECMDADRLAALRSPLSGIGADAVISGLPLISMPANKVRLVLDGAFSLLRLSGAFYQFTYMPRCPVSSSLLDGLGLQSERIGAALLNIPPATVYRIARRQTANKAFTFHSANIR